MGGVPVTGNVDSASEPHLFVTFGVLDKPLQSGQAGRAADQAAMQADGKHFRH
jgi:hypothetical protein